MQTPYILPSDKGIGEVENPPEAVLEGALWKTRHSDLETQEDNLTSLSTYSRFLSTPMELAQKKKDFEPEGNPS